MKDWILIANVIAPDIPAKEAAKTAPPLNALEDVFRPLAKSLTPEMEPATIFHADQEQS